MKIHLSNPWIGLGLLLLVACVGCEGVGKIGSGDPPVSIDDGIALRTVGGKLKPCIDVLTDFHSHAENGASTEACSIGEGFTQAIIDGRDKSYNLRS